MVSYMRSCNGLVFLANARWDVMCLWNPCTRQFKMLPSCKTKGKGPPLYLGFGFDCIGNDYKILRIVFTGSTSYKARAELYSANADSWKKIQVPAEVKLSVWSQKWEVSCPDINGVLYFEVEGGLLSFDLHNEVFGKIGVLQFPYYEKHYYEPFAFLGRSPKWSHVLDFEGSVAMIFKFVDDSVRSLWTLDVVSGSWTKKFNLETNMKPDQMYGHLYLGFKQFVVINHPFGFLFYDCKKKATKYLPLQVKLTDDINSVLKFTESLVSLNGFEHQGQSGSFKGKKQPSRNVARVY